MVMRVEHARSPLCCTPAQETWRRDGRMGGGVQYYLLLLDMAYWACFCWRSSVMASSFFNTCCGEERGKLDSSPETGRACSALISRLSDLLRSPLVAQCPELVWVCGTDLVQRCQVPRQVCPKVLCGFREVGDILVTQTHFSCKFVRQSELRRAITIIIFMIYYHFFSTKWWKFYIWHLNCSLGLMRNCAKMWLTPNSSRNMIILCLLFLMKGFTPSM